MLGVRLCTAYSATIWMEERIASPENVTQQATVASSSPLPLPHALGGDS
jgi:hypothetical protein